MKIISTVLTLAFVLTAFAPSMATAKDKEGKKGHDIEEEEERMSSQGLIKKSPKEERKAKDKDKN